MAESINSSELRTHLEILASDQYEGRETGTTGQRKAALYLARAFSSFGLPAVGIDGSYLQPILFKSENWQKIDLRIEGKSARHLWDYYALPGSNGDSRYLAFDEIFFLGYGIDSEKYTDYRGQNFKDKAILIFEGEPVSKEGEYLLTGTEQPEGWTIEKKLRTAKKYGVEVVFVIDRNFRKELSTARKIVLDTHLKTDTDGESTDLPYNIHISSSLAKDIIGGKYKKLINIRKRMDNRGVSRPLRLDSRIDLEMIKDVKLVQGENVLGYIEGSDPDISDELVVLTAHYDHLGKRGENIYYGADDNASGTAALLEICQAFSLAAQNGWAPRRSLLFLFVSGEDKGLLGSRFYTENPVFPLENTIANLNVDMIGRVDERHKGRPNYVYIIGSDRLSQELHRINESANDAYTGLELDYTYNQGDDANRYYYRSDHYNFAVRGIPSIFYFSGPHEDYHRITDTKEKINYEKVEKIARLVFHTAWELVNRDERIKLDERNK